jgi:catechol 2,3-dioxygenase-like lactoylglutathione lyase family enzyme
MSATPQIRRVLETSIYCRELAVCRQFYQELLGGAPMLEGPRLVAFDAGEGTVLLLFQRGQTERPLATPGGEVPGHGTQGPSHVAFAIERGAVDDWSARLAQLGVALESRVHWAGGGESLYFRDPGGNSLELVTPGTWPSY